MATTGTDGRRPGGRAIRVGVVLMVLALLVGGGLTAFGFSGLFVGTDPEPVDGPTTVEGDEGDVFVVYAVDGAEVGQRCSATGPDGRDAELGLSLGDPTLTLNGTRFAPRETLRLPAAGEWTVSCGDVGGRLAIGPEVPFLRSIGLALIGIFGGIATGLAGVVALVVGLVSRSRATRPPPPGQGPWQGPQPGWQGPQPGWQGPPPGWQGGGPTSGPGRG